MSSGTFPSVPAIWQCLWQPSHSIFASYLAPLEIVLNKKRPGEKIYSPPWYLLNHHIPPCFYNALCSTAFRYPDVRSRFSFSTTFRSTSTNFSSGVILKSGCPFWTMVPSPPSMMILSMVPEKGARMVLNIMEGGDG